MLKANIQFENKTVLITGVAGFIGSNLAKKILTSYSNTQVIGLDNLNDYYDVQLKKNRLSVLKSNKKFKFLKVDISNKKAVSRLFKKYNPDIVVNLAAQAGVRYSIINPDVYIQSNVIGFYNILEACRCSYKTARPVQHLIYASSSSVYGLNKKTPYSVSDFVDNPVSLYAATKKSNELFAHSYSKLYDIPSTGLRFFTVYGPAGRPDMAYFSFTNTLVKNEKIQLFNYGNCKRDFTYVDDIVEGIIKVMQRIPHKNENGIPYKIYNIGNNKSEKLLDFVNVLKEELIEADILPKEFDLDSHIELLPMQPGDVELTYADVSDLEKDFAFKPSTSLRTGLRFFAKWYKEYYKIHLQR